MQNVVYQLYNRKACSSVVAVQLAHNHFKPEGFLKHVFNRKDSSANNTLLCEVSHYYVVLKSVLVLDSGRKSLI